jgi:cyclic pyranopterin phosphate synthase
MNESERKNLTHLDASGNAHMVDVLAKEITRRKAVAKCRVEMSEAAMLALGDGDVPKGDVLAVARVAGIQAAKRTSDLIPLCHPLMIGSVSIDCEVAETHVGITAAVETLERTGVEMEALTACSVAALTIYDMCKSIDKGIVISDLVLLEKTGGKSGTYTRD